METRKPKEGMRTKRTATFLMVLLMLVLGLLSLAWHKKAALAEYIAVQHASNFGFTLDELELVFTPEHNIDIKSVCFSHVLISGCARNVSIEWQWPTLKTVSVDSIIVEQAELSMPSKFIVPGSFASHSNNNFFANTLNPLHSLLTAAELPFAIRVYNAQLDTPYLTIPLHVSMRWDGAIKQLNLASAEPTSAFELNVAQNENQLSGSVRLNVTNTLSMIAPSFDLAAQLPNLHTIKGDAIVNWTWLQDVIQVDANLNDAHLIYRLPHVGLVSLSSNATSDVALTVTQQTLNALFARPLQLDIELLEPNWPNWLAASKLPPPLQTLVIEHTSPTLTLSSLSQAQWNLHTQTLKLDALDANWSSVSVQTKNIQISPDSQSLTADVQGQINVTSLEPRLANPVQINMSLDFKKDPEQSLLKIEHLNVNTESWRDENVVAEEITFHATGRTRINNVDQITSELNYQLDVASLKHEFSTLKHLHTSGQLSSNQKEYKTKGVLGINHATTNRQQLGAFSLKGNIDKASFDYHLAKAPLPVLKNVLQLPALKPLKLTSGKLNLAFTSLLDIKTRTLETASAKLSATDVTGEFNDTPWHDLSYFDEFEFSHGVWQSVLPTQTNLTVASLTKSESFKNINTNFSIYYANHQPRITVTDVALNAFGGQLHANQLTWPVIAPQHVAVDVTKLDLTHLLSLQKSDGIVVEGYISGQLPMMLATNAQGKTQVSIQEGLLNNVGPALIRVKDNPAVKNLKKQQANLKLAFEALEHLQVSDLSALVNMEPNGAMELDTKIKGYNPDIDNDVNFNLNLNYDLPGLIQSLLIADQLENNLTKPTRPKEPK